MHICTDFSDCTCPRIEWKLRVDVLGGRLVVTTTRYCTATPEPNVD